MRSGPAQERTVEVAPGQGTGASEPGRSRSTALFDGPVRARSRWTDTGVLVAPGDRLVFEARGVWVDFFVPAGPEGFETRLLRSQEHHRRAPGAPWFALMGVLDRHEPAAFLIGRRLTRTFDEGGRLFAFANDLPRMTWNNIGSVRLRVAQEEGEPQGTSCRPAPPGVAVPGRSPQGSLWGDEHSDVCRTDRIQPGRKGHEEDF